MVRDQMSKDLFTIRRFLRLQARGVGLKKTFETLELHERGRAKPVSYTHLTLPTIYSV